MSKPAFSLLNRLDRAGFLNSEIWDFSFRSLAREYAWLFFLKAVAAHPFRTARGLSRYRRFIRDRQDHAAGYAPILTIPEEASSVQKIRLPGSRPLIGLGFCLKPINPGNPAATCPSGRANHDCLFLERGETRPVCAGCVILNIGRLALGRGCPVYIMTSAKDIARDFMFPQIRRAAFPSAVLLLCPYSVRAIIPPLLICGVDTLLISYAGGACADYDQWLKADRGIKVERTELTADAQERIRAALSQVGERQQTWRRFQRKGDVFFPS